MAPKLIVTKEFSTNGTPFIVGEEVSSEKLALLAPGALETRIENGYIGMATVTVDAAQVEADAAAQAEVLSELLSLRESLTALVQGAGAATKAHLVSELESLVAGFPVAEEE